MKEQHLWRHPVFLYVIFASLGLLLARFFKFVLIDWLTIFLQPLLWLLLLVLGIIGILCSIVFWVRCSRAGVFANWRRSLPLVIQLVAIALSLLVPLDDFWLTYNFWRYLPARQQAVRLIQSGQVSSVSDFVKLPAAYQQTSLGREVQVVYAQGKPFVLFFMLQIFGGAAGFVYSEAAIAPPINVFPPQEIIEQRQIDSHWYYINLVWS